MPADRLLHPRLGHSAKVCGLSDLEHRVWITYELASDDYGVMRMSPVTVKSANEAFNKRPDATIQKALDKLVEVGLIHAFKHQGREYCCQLDWQNWQRVKHPRDTMQPFPPLDLFRQFTDATKKLFEQHPFRPSEVLQKDFGNISEEARKEKSELGSLACARTRETANGYRLPANGSSGERSGEGPPYDLWFRRLCEDYPSQAVSIGHLTEQAFFQALSRDPNGPEHAWAQMQANLQNQLRGHQWRVKRMIPKLEKWLREGLWKQLHDEHPPTTLVSEKNARVMTSADVFAKGGTDVAR